MGASAAANCQPCVERHVAKCDELGIDSREVAAVVKAGLIVNRGSEKAIRNMAGALLGDSVSEN